LAQVFYGARWIYKLGLALLTKNEERAAHVRAQIVDYASVCEGLLSFSIAHAIRRSHTVGTAYGFTDPDVQAHPITWNPASPEITLSKRNFWWLIRISREFGIVNPDLATDLHWLREERNSVHLRRFAAVGQRAFIHQSKHAFRIVTRTISQTRTWKATHA